MSWKNIPGFFAFRRVYDYYLDNGAKDGDTVAEIGCLFGKSVAYLAEKAHARGLRLKIYAVDPWQDTTTGWLPAGHPWREMAHALGGPFEAFQALIAQHVAPEAAAMIEPVRLSAHEARPQFADGSCALVMIDGDHAFAPCKQDIEDWKTAVREGGLLAGDDYDPMSFPDVVKAVAVTLATDVTVHGTSWVRGKHDLAPKNRRERSDAVLAIKRDAIDVFWSVVHDYEPQTLPDLDEPTILDVGANAGIFAAYMIRRYPDAHVVCYEPHPETFKLLEANVRGLNVETRRAAIVHPRTSETIKLFEGVGSDIECSVRDDVRWPHVSQQLDHFVEVPALDADSLPKCDVLKVDTEGSEVEILTGYRHLKTVDVLLVECHAVGGDLKGQIEKVVALAADAGLQPLDMHGTTIRFTRHRMVPVGNWWDVHAVGGERWLGTCAVPGDGATMRLSNAVRVGPDRLTVPVPVPGASTLARAHIDLTQASVWIPLFLARPRDIEVRWSSRMPLSIEEAQGVLAGLVDPS